MKIEMAIQLSVKTSNKSFNQNLFSSSEAETSRTDAQTPSPTYAHSLCE